MNVLRTMLKPCMPWVLFVLFFACTDASSGTRDRKPSDGGALGGGGAGGRGGEANWGGNGSSGGTGGDSRPDDDTWIWDTSENWVVVPGSADLAPDCQAWTTSEAEFPRLLWQECGDGCEFAEMPSANDRVIAYPSVTIGDDGLSYLAVSEVRESADEVAYLRRWINLSDGSSREVLQVRSPKADTLRCGLIYPEKDSPVAGFGRVDGDRFTGMLGAFYPASRSFRWVAGILDFTRLAPCRGVPTAGGSAQSWVFACPTGVLITDTATGSLSTLAESPTSTIAARHDLVVWAELPADSVDSRIVIAESGAGPAVAATVSGDVCGLSISRNHIDAVQGAQRSTGDTCHTTYGELKFLSSTNESGGWGPLAGSVALANVPVALETFASSNSYLAAAVRDSVDAAGDQYAAWLVVARRSDWTMRKIAPRAGYLFHRMSVGVEGSHLYVVEVARGVSNSEKFKRVYRYSLDNFDALDEPF